MTAPADTTSTFALLTDGRTVEIRVPGDGDLAGLLELHRRMSPENLYLRFFGSNARVAVDMAERICAAPELAGNALVACLGGRIVGVVHYEPPDRHGVAEIAIVIADDLHHRGIGTLLIEHLASRARAHGVTAFRAEVLGQNHAVLQVFADAGLPATSTVRSGIVELTVPLDVDDRYLDAVADRERRADVESLRPLLRPASVAIVGASRDEHAVGHAILRNARAGGFTGDLYAVNPRATTVAGVACHPSVLALPTAPELAVVAVPAGVVCGVAEQCGERGVRALVVVTSGFDATTGAQLLATCRRYGMRLVGPNCFGVVDTTAGLDLTFGVRPPRPGGAGIVVQSGGVGIGLLEHLDRLDLGVSSFVSVGDKYDVSGNDLMRWWETDGATRFGILYLESFGNPRKFSRVARRLARTMPLLTVLAGRSDAGQRAAVSHTAATATPAVTREALFRQAGVITTTTLSELIDTVALIGHQPLPAGYRVAVVTNAGGAGVLAADACTDAGLEVASLAEETRQRLRTLLPAGAACAGPVDTTAAVPAELFARCIAMVAGAQEVDAIVAVTVPTAVSDPGTGVRSIAGTPIAAVAIDQAETVTVRDGVPWYAGPEAAAWALRRAADRAKWLTRPEGRVPVLDGIDRTRAAAIIADGLDARPDGGWLDATAAFELLTTYSIPMVGVRFATTEDAAARAAAELGGVVGLKADVVGIVHKSDAGAVILGLATERAVRAAYGELIGRFGDRLRGAQVQQMASDGVEVLAGVVQEPTFGPLVVFGSGGVTTDVLPDRAARLAPLTDVDAAELVRSPRIAAVLLGYRSHPAVDLARLEEVLVRLARLATDHPEIAEIDLNPVIARPDGVVAVDARVRVEPHPTWDPFLRRLR
ncbi:bifunctional GNAT family N-acetyltransferase/acetate--CoA ligase family protein [Jiangella mangrovi]|uniref:Acyl-CoA synthetase (NDP forming)/GNAT superfamily N-acetyltransferase n=1 Tax=Jiangella mangrovi TaxID=1524084 RepID=A0A7W9GRL4_9ACTN|nr:bifunctional GNAT family N-acetyltransferase/acetate--CoA ligase family protein [Jiangella mangrovi]MBB5788764.1 acyl-CoA synthetase (NDP forming)/GNAT superfamily N-acetyltransferase [Jiangella mangrovi]